MKRNIIFVLLLTGLAATASPPSEVNEKVLQAFRETFSDVKNVSWHEYAEYTQANFELNNIQIRAQYAEDGRLIRTIRYYSERELLPLIVVKLRKKFPGKEITGVTESASEEEISFVINVRDESHWYIVRTDIYGNHQSVEKFKRADK